MKMLKAEQRAKQITEVYLKAVKGLEQGTIDDLVLVPFHSTEKVEIVRTTPDGTIIKTIVNAPF